ncbi:MAG: acyltransferase [Massilia sp.]
MANNNSRLTSIQILRAFAAVWVVIAHALGLIRHREQLNPAIAMIGGYGWLGVDVFFIVSGFVIYFTVHGKKITAGTFFARRAERIVPPYLLLTTALCILMLALPQFFETFHFSIDHLLRSAAYLSFTRYEYPLLYVGWTLEYEMLFYLLASCALACGAFLFTRLTVCLCILVLFGLAFAHSGYSSKPIIFLTDPILLEFCLGFLCAALFLTGTINLKVAAVMLFTLVMVYCNNPTHRAIVVGLPSVGLLALCLRLERYVSVPRLLRNTLTSIGDASYSIYLIQVFSLPLADKLQGFFPEAVGPAAFLVLATAFTTGLGWIFFRQVERPMLELIRKARVRRSAPLEELRAE